MGSTQKAVVGLGYVERANQYALDVISGAIPACKWVRLACQRQIDDLKRADTGEGEWYFSVEAAERICDFSEQLPHIKGRWKSKTIKLEDWQCFFLTTIFGWLSRLTNFRRFRKVLDVVPRKNAKTTLCAIIALFLLVIDGEPGAEVYSAATTRDQARIAWDIARKMVQRTPELRDGFGVEALAHSIVLEQDGSFYQPLSRDADTLEGKNTHGAVIDELHAHKTREVFDVIDESTGSREQPLIVIISTEGDDNEGIFADLVTYCQEVLSGTHQDETFFGIIYTIDEEDDWTLETSWRKANPNYGVSVFEHDMRARYNQAKRSPASQASFLTKRLGVRVGAGDAYFNMLAWNTICKDESLKMEDFIGDECIFSLDLASKQDLTSRIATFERKDTIYVFGKHYLPSDSLQDGMPNYDVYRGWDRAEQLTVTEGPRTDYATIERDLVRDNQVYKPQRVGVDPNYNAAKFAQDMGDAGIQIEETTHSPKEFSNPMKTLQAMVVAGKVKHDGDPVLAWAMGNVVGKPKPAEGVYPDKSRAANKIDPAVALIANHSIRMRLEEGPRSAYAGAKSIVI